MWESSKPLENLVAFSVSILNPPVIGENRVQLIPSHFIKSHLFYRFCGFLHTNVVYSLLVFSKEKQV